MNRFVIYGKLDDLNKFIKANRTVRKLKNGKNFSLGSVMKKKNQEKINKYIVFALSKGELEKVDRYPISLTIKWYEPNNRRDIDNITFGTKFILDSMVCMGIIENDSRKYVDSIEHVVYTDKKNPRIEVEINEPMCTD